MTIQEISRCLEQFAPLELQEAYDNSGLIIGNPGLEVTSVLVTLDLTDEVLEEAIANGCNLVISHHPVIFNGIRKLVEENFVQRITAKAIRNNIAVYAMHTNLDNASAGLNAFVCDVLGIKNYSLLSPKTGLLSKLVTFCPAGHAERVKDALFEAGAGHIGNYDCCSFNVEGRGSFRASEKANPFVGEKNKLHFEEETRIELIYPRYIEKRLITALIKNHPYEEVAYDCYPLDNAAAFAGSGRIGELEPEMNEDTFLEMVKDRLGIPVIRHSDKLGKPVKKVAICTGSGAFLIPEAIRSGAGFFLTSDIKYHDFFETDYKLVLADIGHYESERFAKDLIRGVLIKKFPNFAVLISKINTNPVHYY